MFFVEFSFENKLGVVVHACNPSIWEVMAGRLGVQGHPLLLETVWGGKMDVVCTHPNYHDDVSTQLLNMCSF